MFSASFSCDSPDFSIRSLRTQRDFRVQRRCLVNSEAFEGMLDCCDPVFNNNEDNNTVTRAASPLAEQALVLDESEEALITLLNLLHSPPAPPAYLCQDDRHLFIGALNVIPFPILQVVLELAEKYLLKQPILYSLYDHVRAQTRAYPLQVYAFGLINGIPATADWASQYLWEPPLNKYTDEEISVLPGLRAYHHLVRLHGARIEGIKRQLAEAELYPHGYGACARHERRSVLAWEDARLRIAGRIEAATDAAGEMHPPAEITACQTCMKAWDAAVALLAYKCVKLPKRISQLM